MAMLGVTETFLNICHKFLIHLGPRWNNHEMNNIFHTVLKVIALATRQTLDLNIMGKNTYNYLTLGVFKVQRAEFIRIRIFV